MSEAGGYHPADEASGPAELAEQRARIDAIHRELAALSPELRAAFVLRDLQGNSYEDVATALDTSLGTAKSRIHRARVQLGKRLQQHGELFSPNGV